MPTVKKKNLGFSLVEMAIVLGIVALLMASLLPLLSGQVEQGRRAETKKLLNEIQQALIGYAVANGRLPCPAKATLATGAANAGIEATTSTGCACVNNSGSTVADNSTNLCAGTTVTGVLPWVTLGINETDAWGHRYTYRVTRRFADQIAANTTDCSPAVAQPATSSFALCSQGVPDVLTAVAGTNVATDVPAIFVSHGTNGYGAYTTDGSQLAGGSGDELENSDNNVSFVTHDANPTFDDLLAWISPGILFNRMVTAGKLP